MIKGAGYIRCSTDGQTGSSVPQQKTEIEIYCRSHSIEIVEWFIDDGESGTSFRKRPEFMRMNKSVESGAAFKCVVCYDESRWGRAIDPDENGYWNHKFRTHGVEVVMVKTSVDQSNDFAPVMQSFERMQSSSFSKKLSELTLRGCKANEKFSNGGTAPYGYKRVAVNLSTGARRALGEYYDEQERRMKGERIIRRQEKAAWEIGEEAEVETIRLIFELRVQGKGYVSIAEVLNRRGVPCPKRGRWKAKDQKWSSGTIKSIVNNPVYAGTRCYNRNSMSRIVAKQKGYDPKQMSRYAHWRNPEQDWTVVPNAHPGIITEDVWKRANVTTRSSVPIEVRSLSPYLLTGLIVCSHCGFAFQGQGHHKQHIFYYVDGGRQNKGASVCSRFSIRKEVLEGFVLTKIKEQFSDPHLVSKIEENVQRLMNNAPGQEEERTQTINKLLAENCQASRNLLKSLEKGVDEDLVLPRLTELKREKIALELDLEQITQQQKFAVEAERISAAVRDFMVNFEERFQLAPMPMKKELLRKVVSKIVVDRKAEKIQCYIRTLPGMENIGASDVKGRAKSTNAPAVAGAFACRSRSGGRT